MIERAIKEGRRAFVHGRRIILPFRCYVLKVTIGKETYNDFYPPNDKEIAIEHTPQNTILYFLRYTDLAGELSERERHIKLIVADENADLTDPSTHKKIYIDVGGGHQAPIGFLSEDELFIE